MLSGGLRTKGIIKKSQENMPLITVVTVVRNGEKTLEETILSVINQTYTNVEYIIVDGASTDGTLDIIRKYDDRIDYWMSEPDNGIYYAMNKGIALSTGDYIALLNSDDWYETNVCQVVVNEINRDRYEIYYAIARIINNKSDILYLHGSTITDISRQSIAHQTCFISKEVYQDNKYSVEYKSASDYDFFSRLALKGVKFKFIETIFVNYRLEGMSDSYRGQLETITIKRKYKYISYTYFIIHKLYLLVMCYIEHFRKR
jgi:glycosyltransferase involved in cell wall biosynthesis